MIRYKTNSQSCVLDAFATIIAVPPFILINEIGHDGSENGFHTQELIQVAASRGRSVTKFELYPVAFNERTGLQRPIEFPGGNVLRFVRQMHDAKGVLLGRTETGEPHAVAWANNCAYDSRGRTYYLIEYEAGYRNPKGLLACPHFTPNEFLKIR